LKAERNPGLSERAREVGHKSVVGSTKKDRSREEVVSVSRVEEGEKRGSLNKGHPGWKKIVEKKGNTRLQ